MLTDEQKEQYVIAIFALWPNMDPTLNVVDNINDDVEYYMNQALQGIKTCSIAFAAMSGIFSIFYGTFLSTAWRDILVDAAGAVADWIAALRGQVQYNACVVTAAANWRSAVTGALMGI